MSDEWGFADMYSMDDDAPVGTDGLDDVVSDDWRNILVLGRATGRTVYRETLALVGHARYLADQLGCRVEVLLIGEDLDDAVDAVKAYAVDTVYTVQAPDYAPIEHTARIVEEVVKKRRPELVLVFQSRSGDAITAYAAAGLGAGHVIGATKVEIDTSERDAIVTHQGANESFQMISRMTAAPQFVSVQRGLFRAPMEDPYSTTQVHALDIDVGSVAQVEIVARHDPPARTLENADRVVVAGAYVRSKEELETVRDLAEKLHAAFGVTQAVVDRGLAEADLVVGGVDRHVTPKLLLSVGSTGSLAFLDGVKGSPTIVAIGSGDEDPINDKAAYRVEGSLGEAVEAILGAL